MTTTSALPKILTLDGLRALAVSLVVMRHGFGLFDVYGPRSAFPAWIHQNIPFVLNGWIGVDLFFVLSGFLIARPFIEGQKPNFKKYALKRILRILPAYYFMIFLCLINVFPYYALPLDAQSSLAVSVFYHLVFMQDYFPANIMVAFWSLGVEEKFYILAPFAALGVLRLSSQHPSILKVALLCGLVLSVTLRTLTYFLNNMPENYSLFFYTTRAPFHCCLDPFVIGIGIAFFEAYKNKISYNFRPLGRYIFYFSLCGLTLLTIRTVLLKEITLYDASIQPLIIASLMGGLVLSAVSGGLPDSFSVGPLRFISKISYSLYLVHIPLWPISYKVASGLSFENISISMFLSVFICIYALISTLSAATLYYVIERPFLKLKGRL